jgi:hypothetical protein
VDVGEPLTYQQSLRAIGRYFDRNRYRQILLCEVDAGFMARVFPSQQGDLQAAGIVLSMSDVASLISNYEQGRGAPTHILHVPTLFPTGYEDCLRALGHDLDRAGVSNICLTELNFGLLVSYAMLDAGGQLETAQMFYDAQGLEALLTKGYRRRRSA